MCFTICVAQKYCLCKAFKTLWQQGSSLSFGKDLFVLYVCACILKIWKYVSFEGIADDATETALQHQSIRSDLYRMHPAYLSVIRDIQNELSSHSSAQSFCPSVVSLLPDSLSPRHPPLFSYVTFSWGAQNPILPWAQLVLTSKCSLNPVLKRTVLLQGQSVMALLSVNCRCF